MQCDEMLCDEPFNNQSNEKDFNGYDGIVVCKDASMTFGVYVNTGIYTQFMIGFVRRFTQGLCSTKPVFFGGGYLHIEAKWIWLSLVLLNLVSWDDWNEIVQ